MYKSIHDITDTVDFIVLKSDINEIIIFECSFLMFSLTLMNVIFRKLSTGVTEKVRLISLAIWWISLSLTRIWSLARSFGESELLKIRINWTSMIHWFESLNHDSCCSKQCKNSKNKHTTNTNNSKCFKVEFNKYN